MPNPHEGPDKPEALPSHAAPRGPDGAASADEIAPADEAAARAAGAPDGGHWLYRLTAEQWLAAAANELASAQAAFRAKQQRAAVTYARRAGGMALNAVLRLAPEPDPRYGRSYMDHLNALAADEQKEPALREAAARLVHLPARLELVPLGPGDARQAEPAQRLLDYARARVAAG